MEEENVRPRDQIAEILNQNSPDGMEGMPVLAEWILVACYDDASDPRAGTVITMVPANQWRHRSAGLLELAREGLGSDTDDD